MNRIKTRYILPNVITSINMFLGLMSIVMSIQGELSRAAWFIIMAIFMDGLDGKMARKLNAFSEFGKEYDSFCDSISCGVATGILIYSLLITQGGVKDLVIPLSFLFVLCGVLRLVRFNLVTELSGKKSDFIGMPIPAAAGLVSSYYIFTNAIWGQFVGMNLFLVMVFLVAIFMVSNMPYQSIDTVMKKMWFGISVAIIICTIFFAKYILFPLVLSYTLYNCFIFYDFGM